MRRFEAARAVAVAAVIAIATMSLGVGLGAASAGSERAEPGTSAPPGALPTHAELERATERFLSERETARARPGRSRGGGAGVSSSARKLLPESTVVAFYGAPQMGRTILGMRSPAGAARELETQMRPYAGLTEGPVLGAFDLVSVFATAGGGPDGLYRSHQSDDVIAIYLEQARAVGARLMLDIQPGRSTFLAEVRRLRGWLAQPDVDVALDPEWNVGRRGVPGQTEGSVGARQLNRVTARIQRIVDANALPPKLVAVHQFRQGSVRGRSRIRARPGVQPFLNFDGIGSPAAKEAGYVNLATPRLEDGFSLFYSLDRPLMSPSAVVELEPRPSFLLYQ